MLQVAGEAAEALGLWGLWFNFFSSLLRFITTPCLPFSPFFLSFCLTFFHFSFHLSNIKNCGSCMLLCYHYCFHSYFHSFLYFCSLCAAKCLYWTVLCLWTGTTNYSMTEQHLAQFLVTLLALQNYKPASNCKSVERNHTTSHSILFLNVFDCFGIFTENQVFWIA